MKRVEKEKKKQAKKEKVLNDKSELRKKMSVIATTTLDNDEDLLMSRKLWDSVRDKGFDAAGEKSDESSDSDEERKALRESDDSEDEDEDEESSSGDELPDEKQAQISAMADQMEDAITRQKEYQMTVDRKMAGKEHKKKELIEQQRLRLEDMQEREALDNAGFLEDESDDDQADLDSEDKAYRETDPQR